MKEKSLLDLRKQIGDWAFVRYLRNCQIPIGITLRVMFGPNYVIRKDKGDCHAV